MRNKVKINLPRLAPSIWSQNAASYYDSILALFEPRASTGKVIEPKPKGKILSKPTKGPKRDFGKIEIRFFTALGEKKNVISFSRELFVSDDAIAQCAKELNCSVGKIKDLLKSKKMNFSQQ